MRNHNDRIYRNGKNQNGILKSLNKFLVNFMFYIKAKFQKISAPIFKNITRLQTPNKIVVVNKIQIVVAE